MFQKILVPLDGSPIAEAALAPAVYLAALGAGEILLVRVVLPPAPFSMSDASAPDFALSPADQPEGCEAYLFEKATELRAQGCRVTTHTVTAWDPAEAILSLTQRDRPDLIVLTSHGRSGVKSLCFGSVAEKLARTALCPVLIMGHQAVKEALSVATASALTDGRRGEPPAGPAPPG